MHHTWQCSDVGLGNDREGSTHNPRQMPSRQSTMTATNQRLSHNMPRHQFARHNHACRPCRHSCIQGRSEVPHPCAPAGRATGSAPSACCTGQPAARVPPAHWQCLRVHTGLVACKLAFHGLCSDMSLTGYTGKHVVAVVSTPLNMLLDLP